MRRSTKAFCRTGLGGSSGTAAERGRLGAGSPSVETAERTAGCSSAERDVNPSELLHERVWGSASPSPVPASSMLLIVAASSMAFSYAAFISARLGVRLGVSVLFEGADSERIAGAAAAGSASERVAGAAAAGSAEGTAELPGAWMATAFAMAAGSSNGAAAAAEAARNQRGGSPVPGSIACAHSIASE